MFTTELKYVLVRYMLNELGDEAANVGIVAVTNDPFRLISRSLPDPTIKSRMDAKVHRDAVQRFIAQVTSIQSSFVAGTTGDMTLADKVFERLSEISGGLVRVSPQRTVLTNDVEHEVALLFRQMVSTRDPSHVHLIEPRDPLGGLRREASTALIKAFREGYGRLNRQLFTRGYAVKGVKHKSVFDLAMHTGTKRKPKEHIFQHLLVLPDAEDTLTQAAGLCWRWEDVCKANHADRDLTAVLYTRAGHHQKNSESVEAVRLLKREEIQVVPLADFPS